MIFFTLNNLIEVNIEFILITMKVFFGSLHRDQNKLNAISLSFSERL